MRMVNFGTGLLGIKYYKIRVLGLFYVLIMINVVIVHFEKINSALNFDSTE